MISRTYAYFLPVVIVSLLLIGGCNSAKEEEGAGEHAAGAMTAEDSATHIETVDQSKLKGKGELVDMYLKLHKGDVFGYSIVTKEDVTMTRDSVTEHNFQRIQYEYKFEVLEELDDGGARMKATCLSVEFEGKYKTPEGEREMTYDSDEENSRDVEKTFVQYNAPVNTPFEVIISGEGRILETRKVEEVIKRLLMDDYASTKMETKKMLEKDYSKATLQNIIQLAFQKVENKPLAVDSSWQLVSEGRMGFMEVRHTAIYTLTGYEDSPEGRIGYINADLKSDYLGKKTFDTGQGMATVEAFKIGGKGATTFNIDTGKPLTRKMKQKLYVRFYIEPPEELKQAAPEQAQDFRLTQDAIIENEIRPLQF